jgi:protein TonB
VAIEDPLFQSRFVPAPPFAERFRTDAGRRALGLGLTLLIEALLLLVLLTLGWREEPRVEVVRTTVVSIRAEEVSKETPEPRRPEPEQQAAARLDPQPPQPREPRPPQPAEPSPPAPATPPAPVSRPIVPMDWQLRPTNPFRTVERPAAPARPVYGPPDVRSAAMRDTPRVGTAPNGQPLYAAEWYREPGERMMRDYLSTARGPGYGLIACRTVADYRVEDCVGLEDYPAGSNIMRSALAAAWEFRVRPPRRGGQVLVGSWVMIRISYEMGRSR